MDVTNDGCSGLGIRLRKIRRQREQDADSDISYEKIGKAIGDAIDRENPYSIGQVSRWFAGENQPDLAAIEALARYFNVAPGWLAFGPGVTPPLEIEDLEIVYDPDALGGEVAEDGTE